MHRLPKWYVFCGDRIWLVRPWKGDMRWVRSWIGSIGLELNEEQPRSLGGEWMRLGEEMEYLDWSVIFPLTSTGSSLAASAVWASEEIPTSVPYLGSWIELKEWESLNNSWERKNGEGAGFHFTVRAEDREKSGIRMLSFWFPFGF